MGQPRIYRKQGERALANYNFTDIASGTGIVIYNGANAINSAGTTYFLTANIIEAGSVTAHSSGNQDNDYDVTFNLPQRVKGDAIINITLGGNAVASTDLIINLTATLKHYDGTTETTMGTAQTTTNIQPIQAAAKLSKRMCFKIPITTQVNFKKGETLRLTIATAKTQGAGQYGYGHDPANRNDDLETAANQIISDDDNTNLEVHIPFQLDL